MKTSLITSTGTSLITSLIASLITTSGSIFSFFAVSNWPKGSLVIMSKSTSEGKRFYYFFIFHLFPFLLLYYT